MNIANHWYFDSSDLSAEVASDHVFAKVFIPPPGGNGSTGAFVWEGAHPTGGHWADTETDMRVFRQAGRVLIGAEAQKAWLGYTFSNFGAIEGTWMLEDLKTTYLEKGAQLVVTNDRGGPASLFLSRRSDLLGGGVATDPYMAGVGSVVYNDVAGPAGAQTTITHRGSWAHYAEAYRVQGAGPCFVAEFEVVNLGTEETYRTPYGVRADGDASRALSFALGLASGAGQAGNPNFPSTPRPATAAISIGNNGAPFLTGIVIDYAACVARDNGFRRVLEMGNTAEIAWLYGNAESNIGFTISSSNNNSAKQTILRADTAGVKFRTVRSDGSTETNAGLAIAWPTLAGAADINGIVIQPAASGSNSPCVITAAGADSLFGIAIRPKGGAAVQLQDQSGNNRVVVNSTGVGFFGTVPVARPTGVPVTAAGIHDALVTLGLITA